MLYDQKRLSNGFAGAAGAPPTAGWAKLGKCLDSRSVSVTGDDVFTVKARLPLPSTRQ